MCRIHAIAAAQDLLDSDPDKGIDLKLLVDKLVKPMSSDASRLTISGDAVLLPGNVATSFALILHELGTNALKYGAWSGAEGIVAVKWDIHPSELHFQWQEFQRAAFQTPVIQAMETFSSRAACLRPRFRTRFLEMASIAKSGCRSSGITRHANRLQQALDNHPIGNPVENLRCRCVLNQRPSGSWRSDGPFRFNVGVLLAQKPVELQ